MKKNFKKGKKKDWKKTSHQYPSPTLRGRNCVESVVADLAARMVKTTLDSNLGELVSTLSDCITHQPGAPM